MKQIQADVAIIGAGTAGMTAYRAVRRSGKRAVLIESGQYGTTCARIGCMPSKLLIAAADVAQLARTSAPFGVHVQDVRINGQEVMARVRSERDRFVSFVLDDIAAIDVQDKILGHARFVSDQCLHIDDHTQVNAGSIIIATGSSSFIPADLRHFGERLIVNDDVFYWDDLPKRVLVVGTGVIGLELGQALSRLGVATSIINRSDSLGGIQDPEVRSSALQAFQGELDIRPRTVIKQASVVGDQVHVELAGEHPQKLVVDYILMAIGRRPNLSGLGLENTSAPFDDNGRPLFHPNTLQLGNTSIFIAGDATGTLPVLHEAADEGYIAGGNAASYPEVTTETRRTPLTIIFSDPQIAMVGTRYSALPRTGVVIGDVNFQNQGRSRIMLKNSGMLRVYADVASGRFLGAEMAGPHMEHIAHTLAWAHQQHLTVQQMLAMPFYHPVIEEGLRTALRNAARQISGID